MIGKLVFSYGMGAVVVIGTLFYQISAREIPVAEHPVRFAILGDRTGGHAAGIHEQIVREIERLKPEFVITVGDMIEGYTEDMQTIHDEWHEYLDIVKPLSVPIYYTPGNHDITTDTLLDPYRHYIGEPVYSFNHRGLHFAILDNSRDWLTDDLKKNRNARWTFVFYHKPFWYNTTAAGEPDTLHKIFLEYGVDVVVTGHFHQYFSGVYDGIKYVSLGSSGGSMSNIPLDLKYHYGWVTADSSDVYIVPIKLGSVLPYDYITADDLRLIDKLDREGIDVATPLLVDKDLNITKMNVVLNIHNFSNEILTDTLYWTVPDGWTVTPEKQEVQILPQDFLHLSIPVHRDGPLQFPLPTVSLRFPIGEGKKQTITEDLRFLRTIVSNYVTTQPVINGQLDDAAWTEPVNRFFTPDGANATINPTNFYFANDDHNLYLAAYCQETDMSSLVANITERDGAVYGEDCVGFFLQPQRYQDTVYQIYVNPLGTIFDQKITSDEDGYFSGDRKWNGNYTVKTSRLDGYWLIEIQIPFSELGLTEYSREWGLNFRRKQKRLNTSGDWQIPIDYNPRSFGTMRLK
jgi:predicted phosphodiesterase